MRRQKERTAGAAAAGGDNWSSIAAAPKKEKETLDSRGKCIAPQLGFMYRWPAFLRCSSPESSRHATTGDIRQVDRGTCSSLHCAKMERENVPLRNCKGQMATMPLDPARAQGRQ